MQTFTSVVHCGTCGRILSQAKGIPAVQGDVIAAAEAATRVLACPERGHMRNSNLRFEWVPEPAGSPVAQGTPSGPLHVEGPMVKTDAPAVVAKADTFDEHGNPILSESDLQAEIAAHEARSAQASPEVVDPNPITSASLPSEMPAVPVAEGSAHTPFDLSHERHDEHEGPADMMSGIETSELAQSLAANANGMTQ